MPALTAISTIASVQANQAAIEASRVHDMQCRLVIKNFDNSTATVEQKKSFSECVQRLNPEPLSHNNIFIFKAWILIIFICMAAFGIKFLIDANYSVRKLFEIIWGIFVGFCVGLITPLCFFLIYAGIVFLFK